MKKIQREVYSAHDRAFQSVMSDPRVAKDMLSHHLPQEIKEKIDLDSLQLEHGSFIDPELKALHTDILYSILLRNTLQEKAYIYVHVEHQSSPDKMMAFRMVKYAIKIIDRDLKSDHKTSTLPVIIPVVIYNGKNTYPYSLNIFDLFGENKSLAEKFMFKIFHLVDFNTVSDEEIRQHKWSCLLEMLLKHIHDQEIMTSVEQLTTEIQQIIRDSADDYIVAMIKYILEKAEMHDRERFLRWVKAHLPRKLEKQAMTLAEQFRNEGRQEGIQQGMRQGIQRGALEGERTLLKRLLAKRFGLISTSYLKKIENADADNLLQWSENILEAKSIEEVFKDYH